MRPLPTLSKTPLHNMHMQTTVVGVGDLRVEQLQVLTLALLLCLLLKLSCPLSGLLQFTLQVSHLECVSECV